MNNCGSNNKGFTLVELLAVIVILAIIMIIAIPSVLNTMNLSKLKTFSEYVDKLYSTTIQKYSTDVIKGTSKNGSVIYDINSDLDLPSTGNYKGYVMLDTNTNDVYITLHDDDYELVGYKYDSSNKVEDAIESKTLGGEVRFSAEYLCGQSSGNSCVFATKDTVIDNQEFVKENSSYLVSGTKFNYALRTLYGVANTLSVDLPNITAFKRSSTLNEGATKQEISESSSKYKTYVWAEGSVVYYYTEAPGKLMLNSISSYMFYKMSNLVEIDTSLFDTSNVTNMSYMFGCLNNIERLDISRFKTNNVTDFSKMFFFDENLTYLDLSHFNTSKAEYFTSMFYTCRKLQNLDFSSFNTANVKSMQGMFCGCAAIKTLDISSFDTSSVTDTSEMFSYCNNIETIYVSGKWNMSKVTTSNYMFRNCSKLKKYNSSEVDVSKANYSDTGYLTKK